MDKARKKALLKSYQEKQREAYLGSLPMPMEGFMALFDYLNALDKECEGDLRSTVIFLEENHYPVEQVVNWLQDHGGYCDCEVLFNVKEEFNF